MTAGSAPPVVRGEPVAVAEGVYVISDNRVPIVPNIGIVVGDSATLVIDTGLGRDNGAYVLEHARRLAGGGPVYVATTHVDPGHGFGTAAFKEHACIVFHKTQVEEMHRLGHEYIDTFSRLRPELTPLLRSVEFVKPDIVFSDGQLELDLGGHRALLRHYGPAHAADDQVVLVDDRVLFAGDLVLTGQFPIVPYFPPFDADVDAYHWIDVLDELTSLQPAIVVPGHGELSDSRAIAEVRDFLTYVRDMASQLRANGASADDAAASIEAKARARWTNWGASLDGSSGLAGRAFYSASTTGLLTGGSKHEMA